MYRRTRPILQHLQNNIRHIHSRLIHHQPTMSQTQRALVVRTIASPLVLDNNWSIPTPNPNQVQLKVTVAGLNPHDQKARDTGLFIANDLPAVLANDVVGRVTAVGTDVTKYAVGDRIVLQGELAPGSRQNGLQEYAVADTIASAKIPDGVLDEEAATLPSNLMAGVVALFETLKIPAPWMPGAEGFDYKGSTILIVGGGSSCGRLGVQLAKLAGIGRIVVVGGPEEKLLAEGATHVIDRHGGHDAVLGKIRDIVGDELVYAYDAVNPPEGQLLALQALSKTRRGALARLVRRGTLDESRIGEKEQGYDLRNVFGSSHLHPELAGRFWENLPGYLEKGDIKTLGFEVKDGLNADAVNGVLDAYRDGKPVTKTHFKF